jgi:hypothetical protein
MKHFLTCLIVSACIATISAKSQTISVDAGNVVKTFSSNPKGISLDYLMEDYVFLNPAISLQIAIMYHMTIKL